MIQVNATRLAVPGEARTEISLRATFIGKRAASRSGKVLTASPTEGRRSSHRTPCVYDLGEPSDEGIDSKPPLGVPTAPHNIVGVSTNEI